MKRLLHGYYGSVIVLVWATVGVAGVQWPAISVYVEDSPAAKELIGQARRLREQQRLAESAALYQQVIDQYPHKLMKTGQAKYTDAARWVRDLLQSDDELLVAYRRHGQPLAQRALDQAPSTGSQIKALERVMARYGLCRAGLDAGLRLAGVYMEAAQFSNATAVLDELGRHPDLADQAASWHRLQAGAGLFVGDRRRYQLHLKALRDLGDGRAVQEMDAWSSSLRRPETSVAFDSKGVVPKVRVPDPLGASLWSKTISTTGDADQAKVVIRGPVQIRGRVRIQRRMGSVYDRFPVVPVAWRDWLYVVADASSVVAMDRISGREHWSFDLKEEVSSADPTGLLVAASAMAEQRAVLLHGDTLLAVLGVPSPVRPGLRRDGGMTSLVCLGREDGRLLWRVDTGDLDVSLSTADFYGTPLAGPDVIYVLARRSDRSGFQDTYLLAIDPADGGLIWRRHLFSVSAGRSIAQQYVRMTIDGSRLYIADNLGDVACLDSRSGMALWLTIVGDLPKPKGDERQTRPTPRKNRNWQATVPLPVAGGLIVALRDNEPGAVLLDTDSGNLIRRLTGPIWQEASYMTKTPSGVLIVGQKAALVRGGSLEPRWIANLGVSQATAPQGFAAVTGDRVLVPTDGHLVVFDLADGRVLSEQAIEEPGNVLALEDQVVIAGASFMKGYLSWSRAYEHLKRQIAERPDDPELALALAHLAVAVREDLAVLEGVDQAISIVSVQGGVPGTDLAGTNTATSAKLQIVFNQLLELVGTDRVIGEALRQQLFDRLATVTSSPADEAAYHFAFGQFLVGKGEVRKAIDHYQSVLMDATLSSQMYHHNQGRRQARVEAKRRISELTQEYGPTVYERYEVEAAQRLAELTSVNTVDATALSDLARWYPFSTAAPAAMVAAAESHADRGNRPAAISHLRWAYRHTEHRPVLERIVGLMAKLYQESDQPRRAARWLRRVRQDHPGLNPVRGERRVSIDQWLAELADRSSAQQHLPDLSLPLGRPIVLAGRLLVPTRQPRAAWPRDMLVTHSGSVIELRAGQALESRWKTQVPNDDVQLLALSQEQVLLWSQSSGVLMALSTDTGQPIWPAVRAREVLVAIDGRDAPRSREAAVEKRIRINVPGAVIIRGQRRGGGPVKPTVALNEMVVCVGDSLGRVVGIDRHSGAVLWRLAASITPLDLLEIDQDVVALAGQSTVNTDQGGVLVLDAMTGEAVFPELLDKDRPSWIALSGEGLLVYMTARRIAAHDLRSGEAEWELSLAPLQLDARGWLEVGALLVKTRQFSGTLTTINPTSGQVVNRLVGLFSNGISQRLDVQGAQDRWHVLTSTQMAVLDSGGRLKWRDAMDQASGLPRLVQLVGDRYVAAVTRTESDGNGASYALYLIDRQTGVIRQQHTLGPIPGGIDPGNAVLLHERIVLSTQSKTIVIPGNGADPSR